MNIKKQVQELIDKNIIEKENRKVATFIFSLFENGPEHLANSKDKDYKEYFNNLNKGGVIEEIDGELKIIIGNDDEKYPDITFIMFMLCAQGLVERQWSKDE